MIYAVVVLVVGESCYPLNRYDYGLTNNRSPMFDNIHSYDTERIM